MKIGVIGSGLIGGTLARKFAELGHEVTLSNSRGPQTLTELAGEIGATAGTVEEAAGDADLVVLAVPVKVVPALPLGKLQGVVVIDANNYYPARDGVIDDLAQKRKTSARVTADLAPGAHVVKVFNNIFWRHILENGKPAGAAGRIALPVAADDASAKQTVSALVEAIGFDAVDGGTLDESWRQEPDTPVYGTDLDRTGVEAGLASAKR
jgi:8-hydroxy-5-deazaflavin:NADPH oxidoreductase